MYSGEYDACDVTLSVYPHRASLKNMPGQGGNRTYDLWNTNPMPCQLSYAVRSVRVCDISELSLVPSISMQSSNQSLFVCLFVCLNSFYMIFFCVGVVYSGEYNVCDIIVSTQHQHRRKSYRNYSN